MASSVNGREVPVHGDKLGLIAIEPACEGSCQVDLVFGVTTEGWVCRALSTLVTLFALISLAVSGRSAVPQLSSGGSRLGAPTDPAPSI